MPKRSIGLSLLGHFTRIGDRSEDGIGPTLELALGRDRWQYFGEAGYASATLRTQTDLMGVGGRVVHGGLGARWIARQLRDESNSATAELFLMTMIGLERYYINDGMRLTRPEVDVGVGVQARVLKHVKITCRIDLRLLFTPTSDGDSTPGFVAGTGFAW